MELINLEDVKKFTGVPVEIFIQDEQAGDQAASVKKQLKKYSIVLIIRISVFILMIFIFLPYRLQVKSMSLTKCGLHLMLTVV